MKLSKKILSLILAVAFVFGTVAVVANAEGLTGYAGSVQTYAVRSDKDVSAGKAQVKPGETIQITVSMSTNYYTGSAGGEFFAWTKGVFEDLGENYETKNFINTFTVKINSPAATGAHPSTHPYASWEGFQSIRGNSAGVTAPTVVETQDIYVLNLTVKEDAAVGTKAYFVLPEASLKSPTNPGRGGTMYQGISTTTDKITDDTKGKYAETVDLSAATLEIEIVGAEVPAVSCDYTALDEAIAAYEALNLADYVDTAAATAAYNAAKAVERDMTADEEGANQAKINSAATALDTAIKALVKKADKTDLNAAIAQDVDTTNCTSASVRAYTDAKAAAEAVAADDNATQTEVDNAKDALLAAIRGLTKLGKCDYAALDAAIALTPAKAEEYYNAADYAAWETAKAEAQEVTRDMYDDEAGVNQAKIDTAADKLTAAFSKLDPVYVDLSALNTAIADCRTPEYAEAYYDATAYAAWEAALAAADAGLSTYREAADTEANRTAVKALADELTAKFAALEPRFLDYTPYKEALDNSVAAYPEAYYTPETWASYKAAYDVVAEEYAAVPETKPAYTEEAQGAINAKAAALVEAYGKLAAKTSSIIRVTPLRETYSLGDVVNFEVETLGIKASKLQIMTSAGNTITIDKTSPSFIGLETNEAGNEVWKIAIRIYTDEERDMLIRAKNGKVWDEGYFAFPLAPVDLDDYSVKSAVVKLNGEDVETFTNKDTVSLTITTGADVHKLRLVNQVTGSTSTYTTPAYVNEDGTKVWVITKRYATAKDYGFDIYTRGETTAWADSNVDLTFTVTEHVVSQVPSTGNIEDAIVSVNAKARIVRGGTQVFTVVTDVNATEVRILNKAGKVVTKATAYEIDGKTKTWIIERVYNIEGDYSYTVEAKYGDTWLKDDDGAVSFKVVY